MNLARDPDRRFLATFAAICCAVLAAEAYVVFFDRIDTFKIQGAQPFAVQEFADGGTVTHAFLMRGDGLQSVSILLNASAAGAAKVHWTVWSGYPDVPAAMRLAFEDTVELQLRPGPQWRTIALPRDGSSHDRWYTVRLRLTEPRPAPRVSIMASHDNPDRGGVFWINGVRQPGSMFVRAERRGRTLHRRFRADAEPHLPAVLRIGWVQWSIIAVLHGAAMVFAFSVLQDAWQRRCRAQG